MNDYVRRRMDWLTKVAADRKQRGLPLAVAVLLVAKYFNSETGKAWPGIERLAGDLNADPRNLRRVIDQLVARGYLRRERNRNRGSGHTNTYQMREKEGVGAPVSSAEEGGRGRPKRGAYTPYKGGVGAPRILEEPQTNLRSERGSENVEDFEVAEGQFTRPSRSSDPASRSGSQSIRSSSFSEEHAAEASSIAGWDRDRAQREFAKFRGWHRDHTNRRMSWSRWCEQGKGFDERDAERDAARRPGRQKDVEAAQGASSWLERRRRTTGANDRYVSSEGPEVEAIDDG